LDICITLRYCSLEYYHDDIKHPCDTAASTAEGGWRRCGRLGAFQKRVRQLRDSKKRAAVFLACLGSAAHAIFRTFKLEDDDRGNIDKIKEQFDKHWLGEVNVTYERYVFHQRVQQPGETIEDFAAAADLRKLAKSCAFEQLEDSLIRDRIIISIRDDPTRRRLLQQKNVTLSDAIDACKASEATWRPQDDFAR